jgi:hypothetical protein
MPATLDLALDPRAPAPPAFPARCVACGAPAAAVSPLALSRLVARGQRQETVEVKLPVPHCARCARASRSLFLAGCVPFAAGFVLAGLAGFLLGAVATASLGLDVDDAEIIPELVVGGLLGLAAGFVGGFLAELLARVLLLPFLGRGLLRAPLLAVQFLTDADYVAGLEGRLARDGAGLRLTFSHDDVAREFAALNQSRLGRPPPAKGA